MSCLSNRLVIIAISLSSLRNPKNDSIFKTIDNLTLHYICNLIKYASGGINVAND